MHLFRRDLFQVIALLTLFCAVACAQAQEAGFPPEEEMFRPAVMPDRIVLTWNDDPATTRAVTWRTDTTVSSGVAQIAHADPGPALEASALAIPAVTSELTTRHWPAKYHSVTFGDLKPDTLYAYRVGDGTHWSEWFHFRTACDRPAPFSFVYFGDIQNSIRPLCSRVVRAAASAAPNARFFVFGGDLVNDGSNDPMWGEFFAAGGWLYSMASVFLSLRPGTTSTAEIPRRIKEP